MSTSKLLAQSLYESLESELDIIRKTQARLSKREHELVRMMEAKPDSVPTPASVAFPFAQVTEDNVLSSQANSLASHIKICQISLS